jgi:NitT/TauT family transport system ATP-binding protein
LNDTLLDLRRESAATIVFVTHSVTESAYLADRVAVMRARPGRIFALLPLRHEASGPLERRSAAYAGNCGAIAEQLEQAMRKSAA